MLSFGRTIESRPDENTVEPSDVGRRNLLGTNGLAGIGVGAVAETEFVHLGHHGACTALVFHLALGQQRKLRHLGSHKKHRAGVFAGRHASATANARSRVHRKIGIGLRNRDGVAVGDATRMARNIAPRLYYLIEGRTINCQVLDNGKCLGAKRLHGYRFAILKVTHIELAGGDSLAFAMRPSINEQTASTAYSLATIVVEEDRVAAFQNDTFVQHIKHFEKRHIRLDVSQFVFHQLAFGQSVGLSPDFQCKIHIPSKNRDFRRQK